MKQKAELDATEELADIEAAGLLAQAEAWQAKERLRELILRESDVAQVLRLESLPDGRFGYCIATPFETYPTHAVGITTADNAEVELCSAHSAEWGALEAFDAMLAERRAS